MQYIEHILAQFSQIFDHLPRYVLLMSKMTQCDQIWLNFNIFAQFFKVRHFFCFCGKFKVLRKIMRGWDFLCFWANFHCCKWPNIEQTTWPPALYTNLLMWSAHCCRSPSVLAKTFLLRFWLCLDLKEIKSFFSLLPT